MIRIIFNNLLLQKLQQHKNIAVFMIIQSRVNNACCLSNTLFLTDCLPIAAILVSGLGYLKNEIGDQALDNRKSGVYESVT